MSGNSKSLLLLLQRCVAVRQLTVPSGIKTGSTVVSGGVGFVQHRTWTSAARTVCLQRVGQFRCSVKMSRYSFCTKTGAPSETEYPPLPPYASDPEQEKKDVYIVQVRGFPWSCTAQDLLQFFPDCRIRDGVNGIHFTLGKQGRSCQAFIEMEHEEDVRKALEKHRQYLGSRYVEVYEVTNGDAEVILKKAIQAPATYGVVRLRGLPFSSTEADIVQFFSGLEIVENGITIVTDHRGRNSGEAFVQFSSQAAANEARQRDREVIGNRYIEVFPSRTEEIYCNWKQKRSPTSPHGVPESVYAPHTNPYTGSPQRSSVPLHYIHMRGLPFQVSGEDIVKFFSPLVVSKILIDCGPDGRPNGEADVYFSCHRDATAGMSRDKQHMGERYIELFLNSEPDSDRR